MCIEICIWACTKECNIAIRLNHADKGLLLSLDQLYNPTYIPVHLGWQPGVANQGERDIAQRQVGKTVKCTFHPPPCSPASDAVR